MPPRIRLLRLWRAHHFTAVSASDPPAAAARPAAVSRRWRQPFVLQHVRAKTCPKWRALAGSPGGRREEWEMRRRRLRCRQNCSWRTRPRRVSQRLLYIWGVLLCFRHRLRRLRVSDSFPSAVASAPAVASASEPTASTTGGTLLQRLPLCSRRRVPRRRSSLLLPLRVARVGTDCSVRDARLRDHRNYCCYRLGMAYMRLWH